jgi:hypothetical protein
MDRSANIVDEVYTDRKSYINRPIIVTKTGKVIYREAQCSLNGIDDYGISALFHASPGLSPLCLALRKNGGVIIGYLSTDISEGGFLWLTEHGVVEKEIRNSQAWNKAYSHDIFGRRQRVYIAENVNGDICFSNKIVDVYTSDLQHRFSYQGLHLQGICTDHYGHILIADGSRSAVHVLSKDGELLMLMNEIPGLNESRPISLTVDKNDSLCIGCSDGTIRVVEYLNV